MIVIIINCYIMDLSPKYFLYIKDFYWSAARFPTVSTGRPNESIRAPRRPSQRVRNGFY